MNGNGLWKPEIAELSVKEGEKAYCEFTYLGEGNIRRVIKSCSCINYTIDGNTASLTIKKKRVGSYSLVVMAEVINSGNPKLHGLKIKLNVLDK